MSSSELYFVLLFLIIFFLSFRRDFDKQNTSILGYAPDASLAGVSCVLVGLIFKFTEKEGWSQHSDDL